MLSPPGQKVLNRCDTGRPRATATDWAYEGSRPEWLRMPWEEWPMASGAADPGGRGDRWARFPDEGEAGQETEALAETLVQEGAEGACEQAHPSPLCARLSMNKTCGGRGLEVSSLSSG